MCVFIFVQEEDTRFSLPREVRRRKRSGYIVRPRTVGSWNSPSTVSTSSLAQLHEKLAALPRYTFDKEPVGISALPQLSTVSEVSETEELRTNISSLSTIKYRRYGVTYKRTNKIESNKSQSVSKDSKEDRHVSPVENEDENSVSCLIVATVGSADDSVISDTICRLPEAFSCNADNIVNLLAQEALENNKERHNSGVNTVDDKITPVIQGPIESFECRNQEFRKFSSPNEQPIDESSNEVVENTPFSWVQVIRPIQKSGKNTAKSDVGVSKEYDGVDVFNVEQVEDFFSQHVTENRHGDLVVSPTLARKINETSSECSDDLEQCIFRDLQEYIIQDVEIDQLFTPDTDVVECVNAMVDKVCHDLDKCAKYIDLIEDIREIEKNPRATRSRRKNTESKITEKQDTEVLKKNITDNTHNKSKRKSSNSVKLKFPKSKSLSSSKTPKNVITTRNKPKKEQPFTIMSPIIERESVIDESVAKNVDILMESPKSPVKSPSLRRKRKLYSPKDDTCHEKAIIHADETKEDNSTANSVSKECFKTPKTIATSYKELEQERQRQTRKPRIRLSLKKPEPAVSPKTLKMNQMFDSLKDDINGEPVKFADKMQLRNDIAVYNYTSESEDEEDKKTASKSVLKKVCRPAVSSAKTVTSGRSRNQKDIPVKTIDATNEKSKKRAKRPRKAPTKNTIPKSKKENISKIPEPPQINLEDERMRTEAPEILNTSLVIEHPKDRETSPDKHKQPVLNVAPQIECINENNLESDNRNLKETEQNINENQHKSKPRRILSLKRNKDTSKLDLGAGDIDGTLSPLPGLVVETVLTTDFDVNDSVSANMLQKFKDIYEGKSVRDSEANTTQNLLSDTHEVINYSPSNLNVSEELNRGDVNKHKQSQRKQPKKVKATKKNIKKTDTVTVKVEHKTQKAQPKTNENLEVIQLSCTEMDSEKSMATMGSSHSPITAHGDFDEVPPNSTLLNEEIQPRIVEQEYLNQSIKDFFTKLTEQLNKSFGVAVAGSHNGDKKTDDRSSSRVDGDSPVVVITRLSPEYIRSRVSVDSSLIDPEISKTNLNSRHSPKEDKENFENNKDDSIDVEKSDEISTENAKEVRKSAISPIKLSEYFKLENPNTSASPSNGSEDNCLKRIKTIFSSKKQPTARSNKPGAIKPCFKRTGHKNIATSSPISSESSNAEDEREESPSSRILASSKTSKRMSSPILKPLKRYKYGEENNNFGSTITGSGPSLSSVNEWFKRIESSHTADSTKSSNKDSLSNVLEKLDTTLVEIHHNTSKRFIDMFVDATKQLNDLKAKREQLQRQAAADIISSMVRIVDDKFLALNTRLQSMDDEFMDALKKRAHDMIKEDCKQKRAMVTLLKEDIQAVFDHLEKTKGSH